MITLGSWDWEAAGEKALYTSCIRVITVSSIYGDFFVFQPYIPDFTLIFFFRVNDFEDGNHFYRFLEHEPFIPRCHNFRGSTNDFEPKAAASISLRLTKIMSAILESYASEDGRHLNYVGISNSEEFRR